MLTGGRPVGYLQHDRGVELGSTKKQLKEINTSTSADRRQISWLFTHDPGVELGSTKKQLKEINTSTSADRRQTSWLFTT